MSSLTAEALPEEQADDAIPPSPTPSIGEAPPPETPPDAPPETPPLEPLDHPIAEVLAPTPRPPSAEEEEVVRSVRPWYLGELRGSTPVEVPTVAVEKNSMYYLEDGVVFQVYFLVTPISN